MKIGNMYKVKNFCAAIDCCNSSFLFSCAEWAIKKYHPHRHDDNLDVLHSGDVFKLIEFIDSYEHGMWIMRLQSGMKLGWISVEQVVPFSHYFEELNPDDYSE